MVINILCCILYEEILRKCRERAKNGVIQSSIAMKIQRISQYQGVLRFPNFEDYSSDYFKSFPDTDLGRIYSSIPWAELVKALGLRDRRKSPQSRFSLRGKLALMFLKHYACCSDKKLIEQLNGNIDYQIFCNILLPVDLRIKNYKLVSAIRSQLSKVLDIDKLQQVLALPN